MRTVLYPALLTLISVMFTWNDPLQGHESTLGAYVASLDEDQKDSPTSDDSKTEPTCRLTVNLVDAAANTRLAGMIRLTAADGTVLPVDGLYNRGRGLRRDHGARQWGIVLETATVAVPRKPLVIEALAGLETELTSRAVDLTCKDTAELTLPLVRFHDAKKAGFTGGNTHLHLRSMTRPEADEYLQTIARADETDLVFVSYLTRVKADKTYISNTYTEETIRVLSDYGIRFEFGEEHRHNFGPGGEGYGHVMFLNIQKMIRPVSIGPGIMGTGVDFPAIRDGLDRANADGATVLWCHNTFGLEDVPNWIAGRVDAQNIFDGGNQGSYEDSYYRYMNIGLEVPFSTGTDWFMFDFSRVYVQHEKPENVPQWLDALEAGKSFITNGPLLELTVNGRRPGDTVNLDGPASLTVRARAVGRTDFSQIELVSAGQIIQSTPSRAVENHFEAAIDTSVEVGQPGWLAVRVNTQNRNALGNPIFAHTSAVYVDIGGKSVFNPRAAQALVDDMRAALDIIPEKAVFADDRQQDEVLDVYRQGIGTLEERLKRQVMRGTGRKVDAQITFPTTSP